MRTQVTIFFHGNHFPGGASKALAAAGCGSEVATVSEFSPYAGATSVFVHVVLDSADKRVGLLLQVLDEHHTKWSVRREDFYSDEELVAAPVILIEPNTNHALFGGPRLGTTYDMTTACPTCGARARQTSALMIAGDELPKLEGRRLAATFYNDFIVDERLAEELESMNVVGLSFRNVYAVMEDKRQRKLRWRQLCAAKNLPPMSPRSSGVHRRHHCKSCEWSGFDTALEEASRFVYRARDLSVIDDVNTTWEWYGDVDFDGDVSDALFPWPWFAVTPKVMRVLRDPADKTFNWLAVRVEDDNAV